MPTSTVENYAKHILLAAQESGTSVVPMGRVAQALGVVPGTATSMVKSLARAGLAHYEPRGGVELTTEGRQLALRVLRRHRLIEYFLVETLNMDWSEIHDEAEALEHAVSDRLLERLDEFLGHPRYDPHGDPIPTAEGALAQRNLVSLSECQSGDCVEIARVSDQDSAFLNFLREKGLTPGARLKLVALHAEADCMELAPGQMPHLTLGLAAASKIMVERR